MRNGAPESHFLGRLQYKKSLVILWMDRISPCALGSFVRRKVYLPVI